MRESLWDGGASDYAKQLRKKYKSETKLLQSKLKSSTDTQERAEVAAEIEKAKLEYKEKLKKIDDSLF